MPNQGTVDSTQDRNQQFVVMGLSGTLGPTYGTSEPRPVTVTDSGALNVNASVTIPPIGSISNIGSIDIIGTMPAISVSSGSYQNIATGTQQTLGTVGTVTGVGTITNIGSISTIGTMPAISLALNTGTITTIAAGTQNTLGTVGTVPGVGTLTNLGSFTNGGTIKEITNIAGGTITTTLALNTGTITTIAAGTQNTLGTVGVLNTGTINALASGTITTGTVSVTTGTIGGKAASGAAAVANPVQIAGTDGGGTVYSPLISTTGVLTTNLTSSGTVLNLATGTLASSGTTTGVGVVSNLTNGSVNILTGTLQSSGTITGVGVVSALTAGSITMTVGTVTTGTLQNLATGTINALAAGTITAGTLTNLVSGTVNALASGTITTGTISMITGTLSPLPTIANATFGTIGTTGASIFGTLAGGTGSGAGTEIFITSLSLTIPSTGGSQDVSVGFGTNGGTFHAGTGRLVRGNFPAGGGIQKTFYPPINSGTNAQLAYFQAGAGTVEIDITYFITPSTI